MGTSQMTEINWASQRELTAEKMMVTAANSGSTYLGKDCELDEERFEEDAHSKSF